MTAPVGLTRAEEAAERPPAVPRAVVPAPPGVARCRVIVPPTGNACEAAAKVAIVWCDEDRTPACLDCARHLQQQAPSGAIRKVEPL